MLATAPDDVNQTESQANQDACELTLSGNTITIDAPLDTLNSFASTDESQGSGKWVGILVGTGLSTIIGLQYNTYAFTETDVADATSVGGTAGQFVVWFKADVVVDTPKVFTIRDSTGYNILAEVNIVVNDTSA